MSNPAFGAAIRRVRAARRLTQAGLAVRAGLTRKALIKIEGDRRWPHESQRLISALGFEDADQLMKAAGLSEREKPLTAATTAVRSCESCGSVLPPDGPRRGRPRVRCVPCAANRSALGRAWRAQHSAAVAKYNERRRPVRPISALLDVPGAPHTRQR